MKHVSLLFTAIAFAFMFTSCNGDSLTDQVAPTATTGQSDTEGVSADCKTLDIAYETEMEFTILEAKGVKVDFSRPGGLRIQGGEDTEDITLGPVSTTVDLIYQFFTDDARGTVVVVEQGQTEFIELQVVGRQVTVGKNTIQVPVIGVSGSGNYREYNRATGLVTIELYVPLEEALGEIRGTLTVQAQLDCDADDHF